MKPLFFCAFIGISFNLIAQNYNPFPNTADTLFFVNDSNVVRMVKIDSAITAVNSTVYYAIHEWVDAGDTNANPTCWFTATGDSWLGSKTIDSITHIRFVNKFFELTVPKRLTINQTVPVGFLNLFGNNFLLKLKADSISDNNGDTLRHYLLKIETQTGTPYRAGLPVVLSKNNGIMQMPDLRASNVFHMARPYLPIAYKRINTFEPLTPKLIFNWQIGDVFEYSISNSSSSGSVNFLERRTILSKRFSQNQDSVIYSIETKRDPFFGGVRIITEKYSISGSWPLTYQGFLADSILPLYEGIRPRQVSHQKNMISSRSGINITNTPLLNFSGCYQLGISQDYKSFSLAKGIGVVEQSTITGTAPSSITTNKLTYYKKGGETWGTSANLDIPQPTAPPFTVYPNPTRGMLNFSISHPIEVEIFNLSGQVVDQQFTKAGSIDLSALKKGFYFIKTPQGAIKVIKE